MTKRAVNVFVLLNVMVTVIHADMSCSIRKIEVSRASITCDFGTNIKESKQSFTILRYSYNTTEFDSVTGTKVAVCSWQQDGQLVYHVVNGYELHKADTVTNTATLYTDTLTKDHGGIYECQVGPGSNPASAAVPTCNQRCILTVPDDVVNTTPYPTPCVCGECGQTDCNESGLKAGIAVLVVIVIIFIVSLVVVFILLIRKHGASGVYKEIRGLFSRRENPHDTTVLSTTEEKVPLTRNTADTAATSVEYATVTKRTKRKAREDEDVTTSTAHPQSGTVSPEPEVPTRSTPEGTEDEDETTPFTGSVSCQPEAPKRKTKKDSAARSKETTTPLTDHTVVVSVGHEVPTRTTTTTNAESQTSPTETKAKETQAGAKVTEQRNQATLTTITGSGVHKSVQTYKVIEQLDKETVTTGWTEPAVGTQYSYKKEDIDLSQWSKEDIREWLAEKLLDDAKCGTFLDAQIDGSKIQTLHLLSVLKDQYNMPDKIANSVKKWIKELIEENDKRMKKKQEKEQVASPKRRAPGPPTDRYGSTSSLSNL